MSVTFAIASHRPASVGDLVFAETPIRLVSQVRDSSLKHLWVEARRQHGSVLFRKNR